MDRLQLCYERELDYLRNAFLRRFVENSDDSSNHSDAANQLGIDADGFHDPSVRELVDAFAFLNARTNQRINDGYSEVLEGFLNVLHPQLLRPIPSSAVAQVVLASNLSPEVHVLPRGTAIKTGIIDGKPLGFRTCCDLNLVPAKLSACTLRRPTTKAESALPGVSVMSMELECLAAGAGFNKLKWLDCDPSLRFFVKEQRDDSCEFIGYLMQCLTGISVVSNGKYVGELSADDVTFSSIEEEQTWLPSARTAFCDQLLYEWLAYPRRLSFFDVNVKRVFPKIEGSRLELLFHFHSQSAHENMVQPLGGDLASGGKIEIGLGCVPIINLFSQPSVAIEHSLMRLEHPVVIDEQRLDMYEVFSVDHVELLSRTTNEIREFAPMHEPFLDATDDRRFLQDSMDSQYSIRREYVAGESIDHPPVGSDVFISLAGEIDDVASTMRVDVTAFNANMPQQVKAHQTRLKLDSPNQRIRALNLVTKPTVTIRPTQNSRNLWCLVSHFTRNCLAIRDADGLRQLLRTYEIASADEDRRQRTRRFIDALQECAIEPVVGRRMIRDGARTSSRFVQGHRFKVQLSNLSDSEAYVFSYVLAKYLSQSCNVNSFVLTNINVTGGLEFEFDEKGKRAVL